MRGEGEGRGRDEYRHLKPKPQNTTTSSTNTTTAGLDTTCRRRSITLIHIHPALAALRPPPFLLLLSPPHIP